MLKICSVMLLPALKPACSSAKIFFVCGFNPLSIIFSMTLLGWLIRLIVRWFWHCCRLSFLGSVMTKDWVHGVGHFPVSQVLLQIVVRAVITSSPPAWTSSAGICRLQLISLSSIIVMQPSLLCEGWTGRPLCLSWDSSLLVDGLVIVQLRAVFCPSVQFLSLFC